MKVKYCKCLIIIECCPFCSFWFIQIILEECIHLLTEESILWFLMEGPIRSISETFLDWKKFLRGSSAKFFIEMPADSWLIEPPPETIGFTRWQPMPWIYCDSTAAEPLIESELPLRNWSGLKSLFVNNCSFNMLLLLCLPFYCTDL